MPSTVIARMHYDEARRRLAVTFVDGDVYAYDGVSRDTYEAFRGAPSKGRFFAYQIRDRYPYRRIKRGAGLH